MANDLLRMSGKEICQLLSTTRMSLNRWCREGCPRNSDGSYPAPQVVQWILNRVESKLAAKGISPEDSKWLEQVRKFNALRSELSYEVQKGKYTLTEEALAQHRRPIQAVVQVFDSFPDRVAPQLVAKTRAEAHRILAAEIYAARMVLAAGVGYSDEEVEKIIFAGGGLSPAQALEARVQAQRSMPIYMQFEPVEQRFVDTRDGTVVPEAEAEAYVRRYPYKDGKDDERAAFRAAIEAGGGGASDATEK